MYLDYWGLTETPFKNVPIHDTFFKSPQHEEALIRLQYTVEQRKGAAMLTGEVGSGKTTISRVLIDGLAKDNFTVKTIVNPALNSIDIIRNILLKFGEETGKSSKTILLERLHRRLSDNDKQGLNTVLIIDEAHLIKDRSSFEELRMLLNIQSEENFLMTLIIMGQLPLIGKVSGIKPLNERISIRYNLEPLDPPNTVRYILFRLKRAGAVRQIFTKASFLELVKYSRGIPLRINNICDRCLLVGMMMKSNVIDRNITLNAIKDLK